MAVFLAEKPLELVAYYSLEFAIMVVRLILATLKRLLVGLAKKEGWLSPV
jgi:hypothetical protein